MAKLFKSSMRSVEARLSMIARNPYAQQAAKRKAGAMKHKNSSKGGARNSQRDVWDEVYETDGDK